MTKDSRIRRFLMRALRYLALSVSFAVVLYILFSLVFSTAEERRLARENRLFAERYNTIVEKTALIGDVLDRLQEKDNDIYQGLFKADVPDPVAPEGTVAISDSLSEREYIAQVGLAGEKLTKKSRWITRNLQESLRLLSMSKDSIPPLMLPLRGLSYVQTGAGIGLKQNPVYKLAIQHNGLDLVAPEGEKVYAAGHGTVARVNRSRKGLGNTVEINHGRGIVTRYCLLGDILVSEGKKVEAGQCIGTVGISPSLPSPHLHFEVWRNGEVCNPVDYFFASLSPEAYDRMRFLATRTSQSLD